MKYLIIGSLIVGMLFIANSAREGGLGLLIKFSEKFKTSQKIDIGVSFILAIACFYFSWWKAKTVCDAKAILYTSLLVLLVSIIIHQIILTYFKRKY